MIRRLVFTSALILLAGCAPIPPTPEFLSACTAAPPDRIARTVAADVVLLAPYDLYSDVHWTGPDPKAADTAHLAQCWLCAELLIEHDLRAVEFVGPRQTDIARIHRLSLGQAGDPLCDDLHRPATAPDANRDAPVPPPGRCWRLETDTPRTAVFAINQLDAPMGRPLIFRRTTQLVEIATREVLAEAGHLYQAGNDLTKAFCDAADHRPTREQMRYVLEALR
jgi:hypothetical protein